MAMMSANNKDHGALNASCPVCGSEFTNGLEQRYQGDSYDLCSIDCRVAFEEDPDEYIKDG